MKVEVKKVHCVFSWSWHIPKNAGTIESGLGEDAIGDIHGMVHEDDEEDVCGICRASFNRTCPNCKFPGDGCPLVIGECQHNFHVHCIYEWLDTSTSRGLCPMCRQLFQLKKGVSINDSHIERFRELAIKRQQEQNEFESNLDDDAAIARAIAEQEDTGRNVDNQGDIIMDQDLVVR
ncbi:hypothetical protein Kpol_1045p68 [Vanderwaltozyma polyspora DSM 70294]|uniref:Anaphase-promoting complex subunit 11 n=1 Tax=Vanderwaltozyma polyspora (strain ATCC 22028 / DSM 70294 / BCRC 21397 / CBS 2163 / NBRC 10782 / NRRL Y-8283 / UCD 57-17) TaxID=436907 RepID=A7TI74_VANPO|nr:uncharacterized protein Kpol_1045p68 [Vanderwaltozyma polyspora DSM 70294]EDO18081.1 hypothetical protein Kpol_1045p68 [Vanderwaltozyma polyspora DSM 70294]